MLSVRDISADPASVTEGLRSRGEDVAVLDRILSHDEDRKALITEVDALRAERKTLSKRGDSPESVAEAGRKLRDRIAEKEARLHRIEDDLNGWLKQLPNIPDASVPIGENETANVLVREGENGPIGKGHTAHWDLAFDGRPLIDFERGVKVSGSRFYVLRPSLAKLQRALISYCLDFHSAAGYQELYLPAILREKSLYHSGQLPKFADNLYHDKHEDFWLSPTAEVPILNLHANEMLKDGELPLKYTAHTPCFRREKAKAGKEVRGMKRGHQFEKVELFQFVRPEDSASAFDEIVVHLEALCNSLKLSYRLVELCTGDLGFCATKTYDFEVWAPGSKEWLEVSSVSNCKGFQAVRAGIKMKTASGKKPYVHTLNASGLGVPRTMIALMESYQDVEGQIAIPDVLQPYINTQGQDSALTRQA